jgi:uncharacterized membrane protein YhaH (DUF805 family)
LDTTQAQSFFGSMLKFEGRRGRKSYVIAHLALLGIGILVGVVGGIISLMSFGLGWFLMLPTFIALYVISMIVSAQRIRDFGQSGCWVFLYLVPYVGMAVSFALIFVPPNPGQNKYGEQP